MSKEPLISCRYCLGGVGKLRTNTMLKTSAWTSTYDVPTEQLVDLINSIFWKIAKLYMI